MEGVVLEVPVPAGSHLAHVHLCPECLQTAPSWDSLQVGVGRWARFGGRVLKLNHASDRAAPNGSLGSSVAMAESVRLAAAPLHDELMDRYPRSSRPVTSVVTLPRSFGVSPLEQAEAHACTRKVSEVLALSDGVGGSD